MTTPETPNGQPQNITPPQPQAYRHAAPEQPAHDRAGYPQQYGRQHYGQQYVQPTHGRHGQAPQQGYGQPQSYGPPSGPQALGPQGPGWQAGGQQSYGPGYPQSAGQSGPQRIPGHTGPQQRVPGHTGPQQVSGQYGAPIGDDRSGYPQAGVAQAHAPQQTGTATAQQAPAYARDAREIPAQPNYGQPAGLPPHPAAAATLQAPKNGLGTAALVLGIIGALFAFIPIIGMIAWPLVILGLIFGVIGIARTRSGKADNRGVAISGTVLSAIGLIICIVWVSAVSSAVSTTTPAGTTGSAAPAVTTPAVTAPSADPVAPAAAPAEAAGGDVITYEVNGSGTAGSVTYVKDENMGMEQVNGTDLPWRKDVNFDGGTFSFQPLSLVAQSGSGGNNEITCRILRNGQEITSSTSSGPYAVVSCSGS